jgi:hypothetical protein
MGRVYFQFRLFLTWQQVEMSGQVKAPVVLPPEKIIPTLQRKGGWVEPRTNLDATENKKVS